MGGIARRDWKAELVADRLRDVPEGRARLTPRLTIGEGLPCGKAQHGANPSDPP
jgi:hypothetical protein